MPRPNSTAKAATSQANPGHRSRLARAGPGSPAPALLLPRVKGHPSPACGPGHGRSARAAHGPGFGHRRANCISPCHLVPLEVVLKLMDLPMPASPNKTTQDMPSQSASRTVRWSKKSPKGPSGSSRNPEVSDGSAPAGSHQRTHGYLRSCCHTVYAIAEPVDIPAARGHTRDARSLGGWACYS